MDVTNYATGAPSRPTNVAWPANGVLYVKNNGACNGRDPDRRRLRRVRRLRQRLRQRHLLEAR